MKIIRIIRNVFLIVGILFLLGAAALVVNTESFLHRAVRAQGTVIGNDISVDRQNGSFTYRPRFEFQTPDGRNVIVTSHTGSNPPSYSEGEKISVLYDPQNPQNAKIESFFQLWFGPLLMGILGAVFAGIGAGILLYGRRANRQRDQLRHAGQQIAAQVTGVERNSSLVVNGRVPYRIAAQWQDTASGKVYVFFSDNLWYDPSQWITVGKTVNVWIDPNDPHKYAMDTSFLPPPGN